MSGGWRWSNVPLPEAHLSLIVGGIALGFLRPLTLGLPRPSTPILGAAFVLVGVTVTFWATATVGQMKLADDAQLVTTGPYRLSRHPMYVAWTFVYLGLFLLLDSGWLLALLPALVVWVDVDCRREERRLTESFGAQYNKYQGTVRRYL